MTCELGGDFLSLVIYYLKILLGRQPVFPIEIQDEDIDFSGTNLTGPLVDALATIHDTTFGNACKNIKKEQERYSHERELHTMVYTLPLPSLLGGRYMKEFT